MRTQARASSDHNRDRTPDFDRDDLPDRSDLKAAHQPQIGNGAAKGLLRVEEAAAWLGLGRTKA